MCPWRTWRMPRTGYECVVLRVCLIRDTERKKLNGLVLRMPIDLDLFREPTIDMVLLA